VEQLEHLVEARAVGRAGRADREQRRQVVGQLGRPAQQRLAARIQLRLPRTVLISPLCAM
jgi:hypothetical protein